ncbi:PH domain-containing protein [Turicibacter sanguinis]|uniref:PH domain-containing protein n=1 Tax=Turicibacter sanguinis TaxID=154288 RepID=UPI0011CBFE79|nr:PH domain-containing protein [Turicibacter sanguinis]MCU7202913.1 PH domain-containing protein [Turicibacter sanguinis]MDB8553295.1 PH domain-containing protein [Turicibacter sanguinis]
MESKIVALSTVGIEDGLDLYDFLIGDSETVLLSFKSVRDRLIVTNKKLLVIDIQGILGKKKEYMVIPLSKITAFSCESAGSFDLDAELKIWGSGINQIQFEFIKGTDIRPLAKVLNNAIC